MLVDDERRAFVTSERDMRRVLGGLLLQDRDADGDPLDTMDVACGDPDAAMWEDLLFAWTVVKHATSNAIVIARDARRSVSAPGRRAGSTPSASPSPRRASSATRSRARCSRRTPSSRLRTGRSWRSRRGSARSSSQAVEERRGERGGPGGRRDMVSTGRRHFRH